jgi:pimeloyl-ACP methyl ester carboxylesterase
MPAFERKELSVNGTKTVLYCAGKGEPLVFFHGAGTVDGFDFAERWADRFRVIAPYHPGFGESGDLPDLTGIDDYVMHYLDLFDAMRLKRFNLVGLSMGGYLAAKFACSHSHRIKKLALIAPAGMVDRDHPILDIFAVPPEQIPGLLVSDFEVIKKRLPTSIDERVIAAQQREGMTAATLLAGKNGDPKMMQYLHRIDVPVQIVWGKEDKIIPMQQADLWKELIPGAKVKIYERAGHLVHLERSEAVEEIKSFFS